MLAQAESVPPARLRSGLGMGKIPPLSLRGLGRSRVKPAQCQVLAMQKPPPNLGSWQDLPEDMLPSSSLPASFPCSLTPGAPAA